MNQEDKIKRLEAQLPEAEGKIQDLFKAGKVPGPEDYAEIDRIKRELKTARRVKAAKEKRGETEFFDVSVSVKVPRESRERLAALAVARGMTFSEYLRFVLTEHLKANHDKPET